MTRSRHVRVKLPRVAVGASALKTDQAPPDETSQKSSSSGTLTPDSQQSELFRMADAYSALTHGCLQKIAEGSLDVAEPVVQCVQIKPMNSQAGEELYRVVMSDSVNFMQGMLGQRMYIRKPCSGLDG